MYAQFYLLSEAHRRFIKEFRSIHFAGFSKAQVHFMVKMVSESGQKRKARSSGVRGTKGDAKLVVVAFSQGKLDFQLHFEGAKTLTNFTVVKYFEYRK